MDAGENQGLALEGNVQLSLTIRHLGILHDGAINEKESGLSASSNGN